MTRNTYVYLHRNKFITLDAKTLDDFIATYEDLLLMFKAWKEAGVELDPESGVGDDYAQFFTTDPRVAKEFGFESWSEFYGELEEED